ncbi:MAG: hypothetical protein ABSE72_04855 [Bacteroidales bacterium]
MRNKLLVALFIALLGLISWRIQTCSTKNDSKENLSIDKNKNSDISIATDSATQNIIKSKQENFNKGNVSNEYINGNKIVYQNAPIVKTESAKTINRESKHQTEAQKTPPQMGKIENNGNLSIGQTGGIVNQTIVFPPKPLQRILTVKDIRFLKDNIPLNYEVLVTYQTDQESENFASQIISLLSRYGHKVRTGILGQYIVVDIGSPKKDYDLDIFNNTHSAELTIRPLK